jgi:Tfp pilus assembly protein PilO
MADLIGKHKNKVVNLGILILAGVIALNIYNRLGQDKSSLEQKQDLETKKNKVLENIRGLEKRMEAYKNLLPAKDANAVMGVLSTVARASGVNVLSIKPGSGENKQDYIKVPYDLALSCANYHTLGKFISAVESYQDVYQVEVIEIRTEGEKNKLNVDLRVDTIVFIE